MESLKCMFVFVLLLNTSHAFVEEVSCSSESLTVMLNRTDSDLQRWLNDPAAAPVVYVYGYKERTPCGVQLKTTTGQPVYNFTIPYGQACNVLLSDLEPDHQTAETTIAIEDNNLAESAKNMRIHHVFCVYTRRVQALRISDIQTGHQVLASTGGKPKPKVSLQFSGVDGTPLRAAKFGDKVKLTLQLSADQAYKGILPKRCTFSDREQMDEAGAKHLTFVQSECPVKELDEIVDQVRELSDDMYYTQFKTFRFGNQTTVYAHCVVQVCLNAANCRKSCFTREVTSTIPFNLTTFGDIDESSSIRPERARRMSLRHRVRRGSTDLSEVSITRALAVLDHGQTQQLSPGHHNPDQSRSQQAPAMGGSCARVQDSNLGWVHLIALALGAGVLLSALPACVLARKLRLKSKELETQTLRSTPIYAGNGGGSYLGTNRGLQEWASQSNVFRPQPNVAPFISGSVRSISEINGPRMVWGEQCTIPRVK